ncbi:hypothetical protein CLAIMM_05892 [Cladophialophora immunda]|nr:hypothetical protein CLAIMM_05892 [Cladophialophora immunda]
MSPRGSSVAHSGICAAGEFPDMHIDTVLEANERASIVSNLRSRLSADLSPYQKYCVDNAIQTTKNAIDAAFHWPEPALESVDVRPRWFPDPSFLRRLKGLTSDLPATTAHSQQMLVATQSLNDAMEILSSCENCKSPTPQSSPELSEFLNRRRRSAAHNTLHSLEGGSECIGKGKQRDIQGESKPPAGSLLGAGYPERSRAEEANPAQSYQRKGMGTPINGFAPPKDYLQRIGRALDHDAALEATTTDQHNGLDYRVSLAVEAAEIWGHGTEIALATTQGHIHRERTIQNGDASKYNFDPSESSKASSAATKVTGEDQTSDATDSYPIPYGQYNAALRPMLATTIVKPRTVNVSNPVASSPLRASNQPHQIPRRKPLPIMASFSSSQSTNGALSSATDWNSSATEDTESLHSPGILPAFQDADKHVVVPAEEAARPIKHLDTSAARIPLHRYSGSTGSGSTTYIATEPAPPYHMTRGRTWLERRAETQG